MLTFEVLYDIENPSLSLKEWDELIEQSAFPTPFQTPEWVLTWWKWFGSHKQPHVFIVREGKDLVGVMLLYKTPFPIRSLKPMGRGQADYLHPLVRLGYERAFSDLLSQYLMEVKDVDLVDLQNIRESHPLLEFMSEAKALPQEGCYVLDLPNDFEHYLSGLSKSLRYDVRSKMRLITKTPSMVMETIEEASELGQALEMLFYLHSLRWRKRGLPGSFAIKKIRCFHEEYAHLALLKGRLRLSTLTSDEEPVGAIYAMCVGGIYYFYQSGFDPVQKSISPGTTLVGHTIRSAIEEGAKQFDFMRGEEPYKARWKPQNLLKNMRMLKASASFRGMVGEVLSASASKAKNAIENHLVKRQAVLSR